MILQSERLLLRPFEEGDLFDLYAYAKNPHVGPAAGWQPHASLGESRAILDMFIQTQGEVWAITERKSGRVIGSIGLHPDEDRKFDDVRMLGYVLSEDCWGKGYMTEAASRLLRFAFEEKKLSLVTVYHFPGNERSRRVIEKLGFYPEGRLQHKQQLYDGSFQDCMFYSLKQEDYLKRIP